MKLYYAPGACSLATWICLEWAGKPFETHQVNIHGNKSPELLEHNAMGAVPVLEDGGWWLTQNAGILNYVADTYPDAHLAGDGTPKGRAEVNRWLGFLNSDIHPVFKAFFGGADFLGDDAMIEKSKTNAREMLGTRFAIVDKQLAGRQWLASDKHSIADAYLFVFMGWAPNVKLDLSSLKNLQAFTSRMLADQAVKRVLKAHSGH